MLSPEIKTTIGGYEFNFANEKIEAKVNRIKVSGDGITGFIQFILGKSKTVEPAFKFNFSSSPTRKQLVKSLDEKYPDWKWIEVIDEITRQVETLSQGGDEGVTIKPTTSGVKHPGYFIEPVIMKGVPNVIYGDKGVNKTTLALTMLGLIAGGIDDSGSGLIATRGKVALLDWENNATLTDFTLSRLVDGGTLPYFELPYLRCRHPFSDEVERIGAFVDANKPEVIAIDSLGKAAGSDKFDSAGKGAALRMFEMLDQFPNMTWLIIGQNAKNEEGKKSLYGSTYYTYYSRNIFQLRKSKDQIDKDELTVALIHEESNYSGLHSPMGFRLTYTDSTIKIEHTETNLSEFLNRVSQTKEIVEFLKGGAKPVKTIANELALSENQVRVQLSRLKKRGMVNNLGSGMWGLLSKETS